MQPGTQRQEEQHERDAFVREVTAAMASGSETAYHQFFQRYFDMLYRHLLVRTHGQDDLAKELTQAVLLRVVRYIKPFQNERLLWSWLRQVGRSCHIDFLRRNSHQPAIASLELLDEAVPAETEPETDDELVSALDHSIIELDADERALLKLAYFDDLGHRAVAERLNTTPKAVESKLARIRQKLRKLLLQRLKDYALL